MPENATTDDFVARDESSDPLTVETTVEVGGGEKTVEVIPATRGFLNELDAMSEEKFESDGVTRILGKFRTPDFREGGEVPDDLVDDIPMPRLDSLIEGFLKASGVEEEALENPEDYLDEVDAGNLGVES